MSTLPQSGRKSWARRSWRFTLPIAGLLTIVCLALYLTRAMQFEATIHTRSVAFVLGHWPDSAGIFNSDVAEVNVTVRTACRVKVDGKDLGEFAPGLVLQKIKLQSFELPQGMRIFLDTPNPGSLHYVLKPPPDAAPQMLSLFVDNGSKIESEQLVGKHPSGQWVLSPSTGRELEFSVDFLGQLPPPETGIPLAQNSGMTFNLRGQSAMVGSKNVLVLLDPDEHFPLESGISLKGLEAASISSLALGSQELTLNLAGSATVIDPESGQGKLWVAEQHLRRLQPKTFADFLAALGAIVGGLATVAVARFAKRDLDTKLAAGKQEKSAVAAQSTTVAPRRRAQKRG